MIENYQTIWTKTEDLNNVELNALPVSDDRHIKTKIRIYGDKIYFDFRGLNVLGDGVECEYFTLTSIDSLPVYENIAYT